jgi:beta-lactamase superfamily II metal-dependent hydrolase
MSCLEIHHINVNQGDATLIINRDIEKVKESIKKNYKGTEKSPSEDYKLIYFAMDNGVPLKETIKKALLIDGGDYYKDHTDLVLDYAEKCGITDYGDEKKFEILLTHVHRDHVNGLYDFVTSIEPNVNGYTFTSCKINKYITTAMAVKVGDKISLGQGVGNNEIYLECYARNRVVGDTTVAKGKKDNKNERSTVLILHYGKFKYFLGGDLPGDGSEKGGNVGKQIHMDPTPSKKNYEKILADYLKNKGITHICGMKTSHHGSGYSNCVDFLSAIKPSFATISSGTHMYYDHPHNATIRRIDPEKCKEWSPSDKTKVTNSIKGYFITEMPRMESKNWGTRNFNYSSKAFQRDIYRKNDTDKNDLNKKEAGHIVGDILITLDDTTIISNKIKINVRGNGMGVFISDHVCKNDFKTKSIKDNYPNFPLPGKVNTNDLTIDDLSDEIFKALSDLSDKEIPFFDVIKKRHYVSKKLNTSILIKSDETASKKLIESCPSLGDNKYTKFIPAILQVLRTYAPYDIPVEIPENAEWTIECEH